MNAQRVSAAVAILLFPGAMANADFIVGTPVNLGPVVNSSYQDATPCISADGLSLYFSSNRPGGAGGADIWVSTRKTTADEWGEPANLGAPVNTASSEGRPSISADGLTLFFTDRTWYDSVQRPGGKGGGDLWVTTRATITAPWGEPVNLGELNSSSRDDDPSISADGLTLFFSSNRSGSLDIWWATRATTVDRWGEPVKLGPNVNSSSGEMGACISSDGLVLFFDSTRASASSCLDIFMSSRKTLGDPFGSAVRLDLAGTCQGRASVSYDGRTLYYESLWDQELGAGLEDLWQVPITPILDFNSDGKVDEKDVLIMANHWGQDYPPCDVGPMPWGDNIVDTRDLAVLMKQITGSEPIAPVPQALEVSPDVVLTWMSPSFAKAYDVYFGTSFSDVDNASRANPKGVLVSKAQTATTYDPEGLLEYGRTYWWRVDFVSPGPAPTIYKGAVLDFTTRAFAYPIKNITATASGSQASMGPERTVDRSGLDNRDGHSTEAKDMWLSAGVQPTWIQYQFDKIYSLHELWVWNSNQVVEPFIGFGAKTVKIEYSTDGTMWTPLAGVPEFAQASGKPGYTANTTVSFGGVSAKFVKLTIDKNWGVTPQTGLSEVRFFCIQAPSATKP